jgi:hypothetical protein
MGDATEARFFVQEQLVSDGDSEAGRAEGRHYHQKRSAAGQTLSVTSRPLLDQVQAMKHKGRTDKSARPLLD